MTTTHHVLMDTSYLRKVGLEHPDFQKLLRLSASGVLKIYIPHIAWEEFRTQRVEKAAEALRQAKLSLDKLNTRLGTQFPLVGLAPAKLEVCSAEELEACSMREMADFATANKIEILPLGADHATRAWQRYFRVGPPFNVYVEREKRRKDIPDSWILETAIDLRSRHAGLMALCVDDGLSAALRGESIRVSGETQEVLEIIEPPVPAASPVTKTEPASGVADAVARVQALFQEKEPKVLGFIAYLSPAPKEKLFALLESAGIARDIARNAAERLSLAGIIADTGNHYVSKDRQACEAAAADIEPDIIRLMGK